MSELDTLKRVRREMLEYSKRLSSVGWRKLNQEDLAVTLKSWWSLLGQVEERFGVAVRDVGELRQELELLLSSDASPASSNDTVVEDLGVEDTVVENQRERSGDDTGLEVEEVVCEDQDD